MKELWKTLKDSDRYQISNKGRFRNRLTKKIHKPNLDRYGYLRLKYRNSKSKIIFKTIHRLVAEEWIENPKNLPQINHRNGVKVDNNVSNLEWVTALENIRHSYSMNLNKNHYPIKMVNLDNEETIKFISIKNTAKFLGMSLTTLIPLIRYSNINPIFGKFVVELETEILKELVSNTNNFGKKVYVYDDLTEEVVCYPSISISTYYTGIRSIASLRFYDCYSIVGYHFSLDRENLVKDKYVDKNLIRKLRYKYHTVPYRKRPIDFYIYDYTTKKEKRFDNFSDFVEEVNLYKTASPSFISQTLSYALKMGKTALIKGMGIRNSNMVAEWTQYTEANLLNSINDRPITNPVFKVTIGSETEFIFGHKSLCEKFNITKICYSRNLHEIISKSSEIPNLSIVRLN